MLRGSKCGVVLPPRPAPTSEEVSKRWLLPPPDPPAPPPPPPPAVRATPPPFNMNGALRWRRKKSVESTTIMATHAMNALATSNQGWHFSQRLFCSQDTFN
jgi:hypothetical protein